MFSEEEERKGYGGERKGRKKGKKAGREGGREGKINTWCPDKFEFQTNNNLSTIYICVHVYICIYMYLYIKIYNNKISNII